MKKILHLIMLCVPLLLITACDVHEFPEDNGVRIPFMLHLDFNTALPIYEEITYTRSDETEESYNSHDLRYIVKAYRVYDEEEENRNEEATFVFTKSDLTNLNYTARLELTEGTYRFLIWTDYVDAGTNLDKYYDTSDFEEIILLNKNNHSGSNDYRDCFRGYTTGTVQNPAIYTGAALEKIDNQATAEMIRPMGKFKFVSTDVERFLTRVAKMLKEREERKKNSNKKSISDNMEYSFSDIFEFADGEEIKVELNSEEAYKELLSKINLGEFTVLFRYSSNMPCSFNMFTNKPAYAWGGVNFTSKMYVDNDALNSKELILGFDYIFVNGLETPLSIKIEIYDIDNELVAATEAIDFRVIRSHLTIIRGEFLTAEAKGGVSINPSYDGNDYNHEIKFK
ncbi:MAG: hypothetical protein IIV19_04470 [Bacteroidaceae bacterium]|nr:hypothetical protein [Bacteroidaceae bacterium]